MRLRHLEACMALMPTVQGKGMCFHRSAAMVLDVEGSTLCIGTFRAASPEEQAREPSASKVPFLHCWVEHLNAAFSPANIERAGGLRPMDPAEYYAINGARDIHRLSRSELLIKAHGSGLSRHLKENVPLTSGRPLGDMLLEWMGIPFTVTANGTAIPAGVPDIV